MRRMLCPLVLWLMLSLPHMAAGVGLPAGTSITLTAVADYTDSYSRTYTTDPASVTLTVRHIAALDVRFGQAPIATPGQTVYIPLSIANVGNGFDSADLAVVSSHGWPVALIYDANADGIHQSTEQLVITNTGTMVADGYCPCFVRVSVPSSSSSIDDITVIATSSVDPTRVAASETQLSTPQKQSASVTASAAPVAPFASQPVTVSGSIAPAAVYTINATITSPTGAVTPRTVTTASNGSYSFQFAPLSSGLWQIGVAYAGSATCNPCSTSISVPVAKASTSMALSATPSSAESGALVAIGGLLQPSMTAPITIVKREPSGATSQVTVNSLVSGAFSLSTTFDKPGEWHVIASYAGTDRYAAAQKDIVVAISDPKQEHNLTITDGPTLLPATVTSAGVTQCSATASDSLGHTVNYAWSDGGAGGSFSPGANARYPVYTARANSTGQPVTVTLTCTATCPNDSTVQASKSTALTVNSVSLVRPRVVSVSPEDDEECVDLLARVTVQFDKNMDRASTQQALAFPPGLPLPAYAWSSDNKTLTISHQGLLPLTTYGGVVGAGAKDVSGVEMGVDYEWTFTTRTGVSFAGSTVSTRPGASFSTPAIVLSDISLPYAVAFTVGIPQEIGLDATMVNGRLACVQPGSGVRSLSSVWNAQTREILISAELADPQSNVEIVKSILLAAPGTAAASQLTLDGCNALSVRNGDLLPGDFNRDGSIGIADASLFIQSWQRWHQLSTPSYNAEIDAVFDIAPRTEGFWPDWSPVGDRVINIGDASAFIDCWISSRDYTGGASRQTAARPFTVNPAADSPDSITVVVPEAPSGAFEVAVAIPEGREFDPELSTSGNLLNVDRGPDAGTFFFTEYDAPSRTVRISGCVTGAAPHRVAVIRLSK